MKKESIVKAISLLKDVITFGNKDLSGMDPYLFFKGGRAVRLSSDMAISVPLDVGFEAAAPVDEFTELVEKIPADEITMALAGSEITITAGMLRSGFVVAHLTQDIPDLMVGKVEKWLKVPDDFATALKFCHFSVSSDPSTGILNCAFVHPKGVVGCDNQRMTEWFFAKGAAKEFTFAVPRKAAKVLASYAFASVGFIGGWIHLKCEDESIVSIRMTPGEYFSYKPFFDITGGELNLPVEMLPALDRVGIVIADKSEQHLVTVAIENGKLTCRAQGVKGWIEESVPCNYSGPLLTFMTNPDFLKDALPISTKMTVGEKRLLIKGQNFQHVMAYKVKV